MSWRTPTNLAWLAGLPGLRENHPLAKHTTFNIGGSADYFLEVGDLGELESVVAQAARRGVPVRVIGAGTNLLIADAGVEGLVLRCVARGWRIGVECIEAEAGLKMMRLARLAADAGLVGFEFAIGVPGSVGGAVYQNAGCWGTELASVLVSAEVLAPSGERLRLAADGLGLGYRTSAFRAGELRDHVILSATVRLQPGDGEAAKRRMKELTLERERTQPIKTKNCGSVFKNPTGDSAGRLVQAAGLKGASEGAAQVSEQHANFIVNRGGASAADVRRLIKRIREAVRQRFGVELESEVELVGKWAPGGWST